MTKTDEPGAGAWVRPKAYSRTTLAAGPLTYAVDDEDKQRIRWAGAAIQGELGRQGYLTPTRSDGRFDGVFGPMTHAAIRKFQRDAHLVDDGGAGPKTLRMLCWPYIKEQQTEGRIPIEHNLLYGQIGLESGFDPGAQGTVRVNGTDMGLAQINDDSHPDVNPAHAYGDIQFAVSFTADRLREVGYAAGSPSYAELGRWDCAVLAHNSPVRARVLYRTGEYPTLQSAEYVWLVAKTANGHP